MSGLPQFYIDLSIVHVPHPSSLEPVVLSGLIGDRVGFATSFSVVYNPDPEGSAPKGEAFFTRILGFKASRLHTILVLSGTTLGYEIYALMRRNNVSGVCESMRLSPLLIGFDGLPEVLGRQDVRVACSLVLCSSIGTWCGKDFALALRRWGLKLSAVRACELLDVLSGLRVCSSPVAGGWSPAMTKDEFTSRFGLQLPVPIADHFSGD